MGRNSCQFSRKSSYKSILVGFSNYDVTTYLYHWPNNQMLLFFHQTYFSIRFLLPRALLAFLTKGQIILKRLFCVFNFFQKMNKNTSHTSKNEFICSFLGESEDTKSCFEIIWPLKQTKFLNSCERFFLDNFIYSLLFTWICTLTEPETHFG